MLELGKIEIGVELAVDARQQVEGEISRDTGGIVVGGFENRAVFLEVDPNDRGSVAADLDAHRTQQGDRLALLEIA